MKKGNLFTLNVIFFALMLIVHRLPIEISHTKEKHLLCDGVAGILLCIWICLWIVGGQLHSFMSRFSCSSPVSLQNTSYLHHKV